MVKELKKKNKGADASAVKKAKAMAKADKLKKGKKGAKKVASTKAPKAKPGQYFHKAPSDFKPHDLIVAFRTGKDGLINVDFEAVRYQGRFAEEVDDKKKSFMSAYDPKTLLALAARMNGLAFRANAVKFYPAEISDRNETEVVKTKNKEGKTVKKEKLVFRTAHRMPQSTTFRCLFRIGKKKAGDILTVSLKRMWQQIETNKGRLKYKELEKTDPMMKLYKGAKRGLILAAAFCDVQMPPKKTRGSRRKDDDEE